MKKILSFKNALKGAKNALLLLLFSSQYVDSQGLLWEISGNGLSKPSYLFGTIHIGDKRVFKFKAPVMEKFSSTDAFAMELHPDSVNPASVLKFMAADSGKTLKDYFSEEDYLKVSAYFKEKLSVDINMFKGYKPFFVYSLLLQSKFSNEMGEALDMYFFNNAKQQGKQLFGLEKPEEQFEAINSFGGEGQAKMLMEGLDDEKGGEKEINNMVKMYLKGDLISLVKMMDESELADEMEERLLLNRNHVMAERAEPLIKANSTFIAVGAAHLPGEEGVIELLRKKGYSVHPVK